MGCFFGDRPSESEDYNGPPPPTQYEEGRPGKASEILQEERRENITELAKTPSIPTTEYIIRNKKGVDILLEMKLSPSEAVDAKKNLKENQAKDDEEETSSSGQKKSRSKQNLAQEEDMKGMTMQFQRMHLERPKQGRQLDREPFKAHLGQQHDYEKNEIEKQLELKVKELENIPNEKEQFKREFSVTNMKLTAKSVHSEPRVEGPTKESETSLKLLRERRQNYFCGKNFTELAKIPTWTEYFIKNKGKLKTKLTPREIADAMEHREENQKELNERVSLWRGDITKLEIDSIVNAANKRMLGGGGVDGAIHRAAGKMLYRECLTKNGCSTGDAKITGGYKLPAKAIIHTVGPHGENPQALKSCYMRCLEVMVQNELRSTAFPCISTGMYGYPSENAAPIALKTVKQFLKKNPDKIDRIVFCLYLEKDVAVYEKCMQLYFPVQ